MPVVRALPIVDNWPLAMATEDHVRETIEAFVLRLRRNLDAHVQSLTADLLRIAQEAQDGSRAELARAVTDSRAESERSFEYRSTVRGEMLREMESRLEADRAQLHARLAEETVREDPTAGLHRVLSAIRRVDEATTLSGILETWQKARPPKLRGSRFCSSK